MATSRREFVWRSVAAASTVLVPPGCDRRSLGAAVPLAKDAAVEFEPGYLKLEREGELEKREEALWEILASCEICARGCGADRLGGETGVCSTPARIKVHSAGPHFGEERELVGSGGSGTGGSGGSGTGGSGGSGMGGSGGSGTGGTIPPECLVSVSVE